MKTKLFALAIVLTLSIPLTVSADESINVGDIVPKIQYEIQNLKNYHEELKSKINVGEITIEEAKELWKIEIDNVKEKKQELFSKRVENAKIKYEKLAKNHPELSESILEHFKGFKEVREARQQKRNALKEAYKNGEINMEELKANIRGAHKEFKMNINEVKYDFRESVNKKHEKRS